MEEPRRIVLILGNGFDINLQLKTSFKDFWISDCCPKNYPAPLIQYLNDHFEDDLDSVRWYDLENELMSYYRRISQKGKSFDVITESEAHFIRETHINYIRSGRFLDKHIPYIHSLLTKKLIIRTLNSPNLYDSPFFDDLKQDKVWRDREAFRRIINGLCEYIRTIDPDTSGSNNLAHYVLATAAMAADKNLVKIYSFNYTKLPQSINGNLGKVEHIHGCCSTSNIIVGTGDFEELNRDYDFLQKSFAPKFNPPALVPDLLAADDVIIFGHSIGENDRQYFKAFFKQQTSNTKTKRVNITIFTKDAESVLEIKRALQKMTDSNLSVLCSQNEVKIIDVASTQENPKDFLAFMEKYISDTMQLKVTECQFLESLSEQSQEASSS